MSVELALSVEKLPVNNPKDPLVSNLHDHIFFAMLIRFYRDKNWSRGRKFKITAVLSLAAFIGLSSPLCGQLNLVQQADLYGKSTVQISYAVGSTAMEDDLVEFVLTEMCRTQQLSRGLPLEDSYSLQLSTK